MDDRLCNDRRRERGGDGIAADDTGKGPVVVKRVSLDHASQPAVDIHAAVIRAFSNLTDKLYDIIANPAAGVCNAHYAEQGR